ncbi:hypothetical protein [Pseudohaliea sp.]|uniref:hypothetical protein n=1 Tax=Pseudohaliea sp. TaxID=2740289 RepID=UPI0032EF7127
MIWNVGYGSDNRETFIRKHSEVDHCGAVVLAAMHFEWTLKRVVLKLGKSPTKPLRKELERVFSFSKKRRGKNYFDIWKREVEPSYRRAALGTVVGNFATLDNKAISARGKVVHGNGTISRKEALEGISLFLKASGKLRKFAEAQGMPVDERLAPRPVPKTPK